MRCPRCTFQNPAEAHFCLNCGAGLDVTCAACGSVRPPGARFCPGCGRPAGAVPAPAGYTPRHIREQILAVRGAIEGEHKQVTVLFCDIVRSSRLAAELGAEEYHAVIDRFFRAALAEVHRYEGTINQFLGDGFMALFGAPIALEDHARRAVLAALGIAGRAEVGIRIGINSGLVVVGTIGDDLRLDYTAFGDTTVLAARLQAAAQSGGILVSERTAALVRGYFQFEEVPPVQVKERSVRPLRVTGPGARAAPIAAGDQLSPFTGRDHELAELRRMLDAAAAGEGQLAGVAGDPGLGKSRLAWEFRRLAGRSATVLESRCLSYGAGTPYLPLYGLVRHASGIGADESPDRAAAKIDLTVKALELDISLSGFLRHAFGLPTADPGLAQLEPQAIRDRSFAALRSVLLAEAARRRLLIVIEDLHWIDQISQDFLAEFTDDLPSAPIMLLATYRPGYAPPWAGKSFTSQLALRPLAPAASETIISAILGRPDPAVTAAIAARGEGNPFFVEELARAVRDQAADPGGAAVPQTVQQVLAGRIDRLSADQKAAIQVASVIGREFALGLAEGVWDGGVPLEPRLQELKRLEFLRERHGTAERTFVFTHALTRDVAYDGMLQARRRALHGRAGAALEQSAGGQQFEHGEVLAYHYARSAEPRRAVPYLAAAGDRAGARYANEEAIAFYRQAITLIEGIAGGHEPGIYQAVCEKLGVVLERVGRHGQAIEAYQKGLSAARDPLARARLHVLCGEAEEAAHRFPEALAECDLAEHALGPATEPPGEGWLSAWLAVQGERRMILYWLNDTAGIARLIDQMRPMVEAYGTAEQRMDFYISLNHLSLRRDRFLVSEDTLKYARAALAAAPADDPGLVAGVRFNVGFTLLWHGDLDEAELLLRQSLQEGERSGDVNLQSRSLTYLMVAGRRRGDVEAVHTAIGGVIERSREASLPEYEAMAVANRAWVAWRIGEQAQARADALAALEAWEGLPIRYVHDWMALWPLLAMALDAGRVGEAVEHARGMLPPPQMLLAEPVRTMLHDAVGAWERGRPAEAEECLRQALRAAGDLRYL